ncbi:hypothetical protein [Chryseobacterium potabilaquae]|uniref:Oligosaccharide repeat unit polymerase n=1 Tax=Chryseobacterium potabilaquae TaxID=2675057 RepID=A0A6N4X396_9FLAO|nr:hypothetical protein [Chryseobacterium potabilaquae]CAA7193895.1 hypothetical protein CHRY9293_00274 [Chryseobacterium potabilaquae]
MANFIVNLLILIIVFILRDEELRNVMGFIYLFQYGWFIYLTNKTNKYKVLTQYLKPSFLIVTYVCINCGIGSFTLDGEYGILKHMIRIFNTAENFNLANAYLLFCNYIVYEVGNYFTYKYRKFNFEKSYEKLKIKKSVLVLAILVFLIFSFIEFDLSFVGGVGSFSYLPKVVSFIFILIYLSSNKVNFRIIYYFISLIVFALVSYESKREIIFILVIVVFIENVYNPIKFSINLKSILLGTFAFSVFFFFIIVSSINRGYGSYDTNNIIDAVKYIPDYVSSDLFKDAVAENFEVNAVYGNALNAADLYMSDKQETLYGETFLKALFVPIPRQVFDYKPDSMIQLYSPLVYTGKDFYITFPVLVYSELLWNFGIFFFIGLILIVYVLEKIFYSNYFNLNKKLSLKLILGLVVYTIFLQFVRGSGLDILVTYVIISIPFISLFITVNRLKI